jgi:malonyl CoA-acyl carrier protein transacylase
MKAWLFQGQGSQRKGMGAALFARFPALVAEADAVLGYSIERLCLEDPEQQLNLTTFTQPAIYVVSWLGYLAAREDGAVASVAAGHSVGEYAASSSSGRG